jgi:hypothetical protein
MWRHWAIVVIAEVRARVGREFATIAAVPVFIILPILSETVHQECRANHTGVK